MSNEAAERLSHVEHIPGLHIDLNGVVRCFARTHGGDDPVVVDPAAEHKATVERIRADLQWQNLDDGILDLVYAILDAEAER